MPTNTPHFTRIVDPLESVNPITGRSFFYGARPWRCDDRWQDMLRAFTNMESFSEFRATVGLLNQCRKAKVGEEPTADYYALEKREVMYYVDRHRHNMIRSNAFERYPYDTREVCRVMQQDGQKMRVWRHQRQIESDSKEGYLEDEITASIFGRAVQDKELRKNYRSAGKPSEA
jgi:hypothetical protein